MPPPLSVVIPVYNEEANIASVLDEWTAALTPLVPGFQIIAVNDGSKDNTLAVLESYQAAHPGILNIITKPNSGHGRSCRVGYDAAVQGGSEWVLQIDSDGQCDPKFFPEYWKKTPDADCIFGMRTTRDDGLARLLISRTCSLLLLLWTGNWLHDANVPYRLMRAATLATALKKIPPDFDIHNIALSLAIRRDPAARRVYVPIHFRDRQGGTNSINFRKIFQMGMGMLRDLKRVGR